MSDQPRKQHNFCHLYYLIRLIFIMMVAYSLSRGLFYLFNPVNGLTLTAWFQSSLHGLRFDLSALLLINVPLIIITLILGFFIQKKPTYTVLRGTFLFLNIPFLASNIFDIAYYPFTGKRTGKEAFTYFNDLIQQSEQLIGQYWLGIIGFLLAILVCIRLSKLAHKNLYTKSWQSTVVVFSVLALTVLSIRGGLQKKPLSPLHAFDWPSEKLAPYTVNTPITLIKEKTTDVKRYQWFSSYSEALNHVPKKYQSPFGSSTKQKNVVVFILESFHYEFLNDVPNRRSYAPFLTGLTKQSLFFENGIANGRRSMDAIPSVLLGLPHLFSEHFIRTRYYQNDFIGLPEILNNHGYQTAFYHGAYNGSLYFDTFAKRIGFHQYHGFNEYQEKYPEKSKKQSSWGVFDDDLLQYMADDLDQKQSPFFATVFTLSSHNPYEVPKAYQEKFKKENCTDKFYCSVSFTDSAVKEFFERVKDAPWYKDTLFVFTADHTGLFESDLYHAELGKYRIPIFLFQPGGDIPTQVSQKVVQQADIPATVLDYLGLLEQEQEKLLPFGQSMLDLNRPGYALLATSGNNYTLVQDEQILVYNKDQQRIDAKQLPEKFFNIRHTYHESQEKLQTQLKASIQLFNNMLLDNHMSSNPN